MDARIDPVSAQRASDSANDATDSALDQPCNECAGPGLDAERSTTDRGAHGGELRAGRADAGLRSGNRLCSAGAGQ
jgi:hypothetical protein